jgi:hypothetical protein
MMNAFAISTRLRLWDALHDLRSERLHAFRNDSQRDAERFLTRTHLAC